MVAKGSIVRVDYDAWADGELFDTTSEAAAKKAGMHREGMIYGPVPLVAGVGRVVAGFDKALLAAKVGERASVEFGPEEGFGERDPAKIQTFKPSEFEKRDVHPHVGMRVRMEDRAGTVVTVTPGRVRVDFNPPMAGKKVKYEFTITEEVAAPEEKAKAIVEAIYGMGRSAGFLLNARGTELEATLPDGCKYDGRWHATKFLIVSDLRQFGGFTKIRFVEEYLPPEAVTQETTTRAAEPGAPVPKSATPSGMPPAKPGHEGHKH
ncbi:MAG TPA: peptidylprolyl isomerase [Candidatus Thermoplasmatota archaeon]|nr:peptidylprolyl isomerase [Candidatus Thermoplasmatota archaeon]